MPMFTFRKDSGEMDLNIDEFNNTFLNDPKLSTFYSGKNLFDIHKMVSYYISDDSIAFGCISDLSSNYCLYIGPCLLADLNENMMKAMMGRYNSPFVRNPDKYYDNLHAFLLKLPRLSEERFLMLLKFSNSYVNNVLLDEKDFAATSLSKKMLNAEKRQSSFNETVDITLFKNVRHNIIALIDTGNTEELENYLTRINLNDVFFISDTSSRFDVLRHNKNNFIRFVSSLQEHLNSEFESLNSIEETITRFINEAEATLSLQQLSNIYHQCLITMASQVKEHLTGSASDSFLIRNAIGYIHDHIHENISTQDISDALNISRGYLSSLFNEEMNCTIPEYINREKVRIAQVLLKTTDTDLITISNYLSFSSQSYFQNIFRKYTGTTPLKYRRENS